MRRRVLQILVCFLAIFVIGYVVLWLTARAGHRIRAESAERIRPGMTLAEVEAILGAPPGDYRRPSPDKSVQFEYVIRWLEFENGVQRHRTWDADGYSIWIALDEFERVKTVAGNAWPRPELSVLETLRRWLGIK